MSSNWFALHAQLVRSVNRHSNLDIFNAITATDSAMTGFRDPAHLLGSLHDPRGNPEAKNTALTVLLRTANRNERGSDLSQELLTLALWPGLSAVRRRLQPIGPRDLQTLDVDLVGQLSIAIRQARVDRITRVAATLLRNVERDLRRHYVREAWTARTRADVDDMAHLLIAPTCDCPETLVRTLRAALGNDGVLLAAVHIAGFTQKEAASFFGISHDAARKRCQRFLSSLMQNYGA